MIKRIFLVLVSSVILAGCLPSIAGRGRSQGGEGQFVKGKVVEDFPNLPLYPKAKIIESYGSGGMYGASFVVDEKLERVVSFYNDSLRASGWDAQLKKQSETNYIFEIKNAPNSGQIIINTAANSQKTAITVSIEPR